ncbi:MAG: AarF/ABC1/UbiB kinase family protein [Opitutaceae bacterium]|nr:AarF/ABC1/UbiB kinase family protein [Opitutaceae bacterium]
MSAFNLLSHAGRTKDIITVLARHGFADLLNQIELPGTIWERMIPRPAETLRTEERLRRAAEELGPAFVKLGQILSMRPDLLPHAYVLELRQLQNNVQARPFAEMRPVLLEGLGTDPERIFSAFDEEPAASASLAQVYFARLRSGSQPVAVKIQRPDVQRTVQIDLDLAAWLAAQVHKHVAALRPFDLPAALDEARRGMLYELDFRHEARNQEYFNTLNPHPEQVFAPKVYPEHSSERVLVMERIEGHPVGRSPLPLAQRREIATHGAQSLVRQVLLSGFFHADPHAGNVLVTPDGRLCLLDWGLAGHLTRRLRYALADLWLAAVEQDAERIVQIAADLAPPEARPDLRAMEKEITLTLREELNFSINQQQLGRAMLKLLFIFGQNGIKLSRDYSLMAKAVLSIEEVGRTLDPEFDLRSRMQPIMLELRRERLNPRTMLRRTREVLHEAVLGLQELPLELRRLARRLEYDNLTINFQHRGLERIDESLRTASNRIALGVIIGSLIIGSSLIVTTRIPPYFLGYPALGIVGFLLSAMLGFWIAWDIIRRGGHK